MRLSSDTWPVGDTEDSAVIAWLLEGDPAIRWQVIRDLAPSRVEAVAHERARVATHGWGRRLLDCQDPSGRWAGGLYSPKWTSTTYTLDLLRRFGIPSGAEPARRGAQVLLDEGDWVDGGVIFWTSTKVVDLAVVGLVLSIAAYFDLEDDRVDAMVHLLERQQSGDGSWKDDVDDVAHREFHVAIAVLEGLTEYQQQRQTPDPSVERMIDAGHEFLLRHRIFKTLDATETLDPRWTGFSFPPRWHYDVLRALDHFQAAGVAHDVRMSDALDLVERRRQPDGTWKLQNQHRGRTWFELETPGQPSRWNTLRALRVLHAYRPR